MEDKFIQAGKLIEKAQKVLTISHKRPDGDTLGASSAMYSVLKAMDKDVDLACIDKIPERFSFLPEINRRIKEFDFREYDLLIVMDAGASYMTKYHEIYPDIWSSDVPVINIDHHASNDNFGTCNIVDPNAASATLILFKMFNFLDIEITPGVATALLTGIYNDTGSLMHSNTNLDVFEVCEVLVARGAKLNLVAKKMFKNNPVSTLKLWGRAMENARVNDEGATISIVTWKDFEDCNASSDEVSGVVDMLNTIPDTKYTCLLNEDKNGNIKGSFRTQRDDVDLAELAAKFGGGGHKKAAGFTMPGRIHKEEHWKIVTSQELPEGNMLPIIT
ncbi:bifunctional oligoribonuclease/PAP phosphatase NrnA [Pseudomonadota bacterium]